MPSFVVERNTALLENLERAFRGQLGHALARQANQCYGLAKEKHGVAHDGIVPSSNRLDTNARNRRSVVRRLGLPHNVQGRRTFPCSKQHCQGRLGVCEAAMGRR